MSKRPQSPSIIPAPIQRDGSFSNIPRSTARTPRKLPQAVGPVAATKNIPGETKLPSQGFAKNEERDGEKGSKNYENRILGALILFVFIGKQCLTARDCFNFLMRNF